MVQIKLSITSILAGSAISLAPVFSLPSNLPGPSGNRNTRWVLVYVLCKCLCLLGIIIITTTNSSASGGPGSSQQPNTAHTNPAAAAAANINNDFTITRPAGGYPSYHPTSSSSSYAATWNSNTANLNHPSWVLYAQWSANVTDINDSTRIPVLVLVVQVLVANALARTRAVTLPLITIRREYLFNDLRLSLAPWYGYSK